MEFLVVYLTTFIIFFVIRYFALSKDSALLHAISLVFVLGVCLIGFIYVLATYFVNPYGHEANTQGFVTGREKGSSGSNYYGKYEYYVDGVRYEGGFGLYNEYCKLYELGDTIDVTYDQENPQSSIATYQQYWYVNKEKEIYWLKVKHGEGRRNRH